MLALHEIALHGAQNESYNIGSSNEVTNVSIINQVCNSYDKLVGTKDSKSLINYVDDRPGHDFRYSIDASKLINETDWRSKFSFAEALYETIDWYLKNPSYLD